MGPIYIVPARAVNCRRNSVWRRADRPLSARPRALSRLDHFLSQHAGQQAATQCRREQGPPSPRSMNRVVIAPSQISPRSLSRITSSACLWVNSARAASYCERRLVLCLSKGSRESSRVRAMRSVHTVSGGWSAKGWAVACVSPLRQASVAPATRLAPIVRHRGWRRAAPLRSVQDHRQNPVCLQRHRGARDAVPAEQSRRSGSQRNVSISSKSARFPSRSGLSAGIPDTRSLRLNRKRCRRQHYKPPRRRQRA